MSIRGFTSGCSQRLRDAFGLIVLRLLPLLLHTIALSTFVARAYPHLLLLLLSIQLSCEADVLTLGAEAQATSVATQQMSILMDLYMCAR